MAIKRIEIPAESAASVKLEAGQTCRIVNTEGGQVVDTWAFSWMTSTINVHQALHYTFDRALGPRIVFEAAVNHIRSM